MNKVNKQTNEEEDTFFIFKQNQFLTYHEQINLQNYLLFAKNIAKFNCLAIICIKMHFSPYKYHKIARIRSRTNCLKPKDLFRIFIDKSIDG